MLRISLSVLSLALTTYSAALYAQSATLPCGNSADDLSHVIPCYRAELAQAPLDYYFLGSEKSGDVELRHYQLNSQSWSPAEMVQPKQWQHDVAIYIPDSALTKRAVVFVNNGTNRPVAGKPPAAPTDMTAEALSALAVKTRSIVVSVSDVPNQLLTYADDQKARAEDDSVAHSWSIFMANPQTAPTIPLHVPMTATISQVMSLAERELDHWQIERFIVSGISKRGWVTWLAAIADPRIDAIAPFAVDLLGIRPALKHMYQSYGKNWPLAFYPYYQEGIDKAVETSAFAELMKIEDPLEYLKTDYRQRLSIPKYIINASGDDFYVPDNTRFYYDKLPGDKSLRVAPNTGHAGIRHFAERSLMTFVNRLQQGTPMPEITAQVKEGKLDVSLSEQPAAVKMWQAVNPDARDFRYACNITYQPIELEVKDSYQIALPTAEKGWQATYVEVTFSDGFVATTPVYITPDDIYPEVAPGESGAACKTIPGRGLGENNK